MDKKSFDFNKNIIELFNCNLDKKVWVSNVEDTLFSVAQEYAGKKFNLVFTESDYLKFGKIITSAFKRACVEFSTMLIEGDFDHAMTKSFFNFSGDIVVVIGNYDLISIASHYASMKKLDTYVVLTEPNFDCVLLNEAKIYANGLSVSVNIRPIKGLIIDKDIILKASSRAYEESFIGVMSKLLTLVDYKFRVLIMGEAFNVKSYQAIKNAISLVAGVNAYENRKEVLIYAEAVLALERTRSEVLSGGAVDFYQEALGMFSSSTSKGDRILTSLRVIVELYEMLFSNNLGDVLTVCDYNQDVEFLVKTTGKSQSYFRKNLSIPTPRRVNIINKIILKTSGSFKKEIESILFVLSAIEKVYKSFSKTNGEVEKIPYRAKHEALLVSTYLSNKLTILTHMRDMGVLGSVNGK